MKVLTVQPPWAQAIIGLGKDVENRTWAPAAGYRGPLLIHAGRRWDPDGARDRRIIAAGHGLVPARGDEGRIIGVVDLVDVHPAAATDHLDGAAGRCCEPWGSPPLPAAWGAQRAGVQHWVLRRPRAITCDALVRGALGLWDLPSHQLLSWEQDAISEAVAQGDVA